MSFKYKVILLLAVTFQLSAHQMFGQDLLAFQAPTDKKLSKVEALKVAKLSDKEQFTYPSLDLYPDWSNEHVHFYGAKLDIPDEYEIDLTGFTMPTPSRRITSRFGRRWRRMHKGLDIKVYTGDTIVAAFSGRVRIVRYERRGYGRYIVIRHNNGLETIYGHLSKQLVKENQYVKSGEVIGLGGNTGRSTGSHLHFETRFMGIALNPEKLFNFPKQDVVADTYKFVKRKGATRGSEPCYHKIKSGDTLGRLARKYHTSIRQLCRLNNISSRTTLRIGRLLRYN